MAIDINKHEVDIDTLFKQNELDLCSIKELYRKLKELEKKISQIKYIDSNLADKLKKDYEKLKRIILDENIQVQLNNKIDEINSQLDNKINEINSQLEQTASKAELDIERKKIDSFQNLPDGATISDAVVADLKVMVNGGVASTAGQAVRKQILEKVDKEPYKLALDSVRKDGYYYDAGKPTPTQIADAQSICTSSTIHLNLGDTISINDNITLRLFK